MPQPVVLSSEETIRCPHCDQQFTLAEGLGRQTIDQHAQDYERMFHAREASLRAELERTAEEKLTRALAREKGALLEELADRDKRLQVASARARNAIETAKAETAQQFAAEQQALHQELEAKNAKLQEAREHELQLRQEKKALEDARTEMELEVQRRVDQQRCTLEIAIRQAKGERFAL